MGQPTHDGRRGEAKAQRTDFDVEQVGLDLQEEVVDGHAAAHLERLEPQVRVLRQCLEHFTRLERHTLEHRADKVGSLCRRAHPHRHPVGARIIIRQSTAG
jgi:hypothetical protein